MTVRATPRVLPCLVSHGVPRASTFKEARDPAALWFIDGEAYDLGLFAERHPGGREALRLACGTNCTELFRSHHLLGGPSRALLSRHRVDVDRRDPRVIELLAQSPFTFAEEGFYKTIARRARDYFRRTKQKTTAGFWWQLLSVAAIVATALLTIPAFVTGSIWAAAALGLLRGVTAVGPGHGMSHFSVFPRGNWNSTLFRLASPFLASTWTIWTNSHVRSHHVATLTAADLQDHYPLKRVRAQLRHRVWHRAQHWYVWPIYLFALPLWALQDFLASVTSLFQGSCSRFSFARRLENVVAIGFNLALFHGLPFVFLEPMTALCVVLVSAAVASPIVVLQIVVNHEVPETTAATPTGDPVDWGTHQVQTSHNFAVGSRLALHLSGGLNMQVEHHLFPSVHYRHYPALGEIVRDACAEFGLPYHESAHLWEAVGKHFAVLKANSGP